jgi:hypothetical protein
MATLCPFCATEVPVDALVCGSCGRDITVPASLLAERDDLLRKRDAAREELQRTRDELDQFRLAPHHRSP